MKKDYVEVARVWLGNHARLEIPPGDVTDLAALFEAAYEEGRREDKPLPERRRGPGVARKEEQDRQRILRVLGNDRTLEALKRIPHKRRAVATHVKVDVEDFRSFLEDQPIGIAVRTLILKGLAELGFAEVMPRAGDPGSSEDVAARQPRLAVKESG